MALRNIAFGRVLSFAAKPGRDRIVRYPGSVRWTVRGRWRPGSSGGKSPGQAVVKTHNIVNRDFVRRYNLHRNNFFLPTPKHSKACPLDGEEKPFGLWNAKKPLLLVGSLCHKDGWLTCTERSYYRRPYAINTKQKAREPGVAGSYQVRSGQNYPGGRSFHTLRGGGDQTAVRTGG